MAVPTTQPFDYPDWASFPTFITYNPQTYHVTLSSATIASFPMGIYQYGMLYVSRDSTNLQNDLAFQWMGTTGAESSVLVESRFCVIADGTIVTPFQAMTPTLRLQDVDSSAYPYDLTVGLTLFTSSPYQHGFPGGIFAINEQVFVAGADTVNVTPDGCGPGAHFLSMDTGCPDWDLTLLVFPRRNGSITEVLTTAHSGPFLNYEFTVPATQWVLQITNNDTDADFSVMVARTPNPT